MNKKYLMCIDGDSELDFNNGFYFHNLSQFYQSKGFDIHRMSMGRGNSKDDILTKLNKIRDLEIKKDTFAFISGSFIHQLVTALKESNHLSDVAENFGEVARIYSQINNEFSTLNIYTSESIGSGMIYDIKTVASMHLNVGFDFQILDCRHQSLAEIYKQITFITKAKGWIAPPPLY